MWKLPFDKNWLISKQKLNHSLFHVTLFMVHAVEQKPQRIRNQLNLLRAKSDHEPAIIQQTPPS